MAAQTRRLTIPYGTKGGSNVNLTLDYTFSHIAVDKVSSGMDSIWARRQSTHHLFSDASPRLVPR